MALHQAAAISPTSAAVLSAAEDRARLTRAVAADETSQDSPATPHCVPQLKNESTVASIIQFVLGHDGPPVTAIVTPWTLSRRSGVMTGILTAAGDQLRFTPGVTKTAKGQIRLEADGMFTYVPYREARRAADLGHYRDVFTVTAQNSERQTTNVSVSIAILGC